MPPRSWLFVPGDSDKKLGKAMTTGAHAVIVDLEDAVAPTAKPQARILARDWLAIHRQHVTENRPLARWVRINAIETGRYDPSLPLAFRIAELFELTIEQVFVSLRQRLRRRGLVTQSRITAEVVSESGCRAHP